MVCREIAPRRTVALVACRDLEIPRDGYSVDVGIIAQRELIHADLNAVAGLNKISDFEPKKIKSDALISGRSLPHFG